MSEECAFSEFRSPKMEIKWICVCKPFGIPISECNGVTKLERTCQNSMRNYEAGKNLSFPKQNGVIISAPS